MSKLVLKWTLRVLKIFLPIFLLAIISFSFFVVYKEIKQEPHDFKNTEIPLVNKLTF